MTFTGRGLGPSSAFVNTIVSPISLFWLAARIEAERRSSAFIRLRRCVLAVAGLELLLGVAQMLTREPIVWATERLSYWWYDPDDFTRAFGTLDSPLDMALLFVVAAALGATLRSTAGQAVCLFAGGLGVALTQSRAGLICMGVMGIGMLLWNRRLSGRVGMLVSLVALVVVLVWTGVAAGVMDRIENDGNSTARRMDAYSFLLSNAGEHLLMGGGFGSSFALRAEGLFRSSLENGFAMFAFDFGLVLGVAYLFMTVAVPFIRAGNCEPAVFVGSLLAIVFCLGYSSFMTQGAAGTLLWTILAMTLLGRVPAHERSRTAPQFTRRVSGTGPA
jgi:hypothetical protein